MTESKKDFQKHHREDAEMVKKLKEDPIVKARLESLESKGVSYEVIPIRNIRSQN